MRHRTNVADQLCGLCYILRKSSGLGLEKPILQESYHTLIQFNYSNLEHV